MSLFQDDSTAAARPQIHNDVGDETREEGRAAETRLAGFQVSLNPSHGNGRTNATLRGTGRTFT